MNRRVNRLPNLTRRIASSVRGPSVMKSKRKRAVVFGSTVTGFSVGGGGI
jgi:hypothetical protein